VSGAAATGKSIEWSAMNRRHALAAMLGLPAEMGRDPEKYWLKIRREQFSLPDWRAFLNNGSLGIAPKPVVRAVEEYLEKSASLTIPDGEYPRWGYETLDAQREEAARYLGCHKDELAFTHNATEALSTFANGVDLQPGDEVLMTDQEHGSGRSGWLLRQARYGITVREVKIPLPPRDSGLLTDVMISAIGPRTRVLFFSGITTTTGLVMPMQEICRAARAKGLITVIDGAHVNGQIPCKISELGCDYYAGSPHKWMFAPAGSGILWGRREMLDRLWPAIVTGQWDNRERRAGRFQYVGTNNRSIIEGMVAGVRFANAIGPERIYARIHELARNVRRKAQDMGFKVLTPDDDSLYGSLVAFEPTGVNQEKFRDLCTKRRIWALSGQRIRVSTHIHTRPQDVDLLFETFRESRV
jgi:isopenicillin-N epimerase